MKAITVRQPWAWAIIHGGKHIENRSAGSRYRGPLAIHAGKSLSSRGMNDKRIAEAGYAQEMPTTWAEWIHKGHLPTGAIIGVAELVGVHPDAQCCRPWGESSYREAGGRLRTVVHHFVLDNIRAVEPFDCPGALGLWSTTWNGIGVTQ